MRIYQAAIHATFGNGENTLFWEDSWLQGNRIQDLAPNIYDMVAPRTKSSRTVRQALQDNTWAMDIGPNLGLHNINEYLQLWQRVSDVEIDDNGTDTIRWAWESNGSYSIRSAYAAKLLGREVAPYADFVWKLKAPLQRRFFLWLAMRNRCWTSDRLASRRLPHQATFPFCNQEVETINHILLTRVFARTLWLWIWTALGEPTQTPVVDDELVEWCATRTTAHCSPRDLRAIITLCLWETRKHRNAIVFDGGSPSLQLALRNIEREGRTWKSTGLLKGDLVFFFGGLSRRASGE